MNFSMAAAIPMHFAATSISDIVRILTISDIFAALIEHRTYKPTMSREKAYEILLGMKGKLERPLVEAFREVALKQMIAPARANS